jgi:hypothetical protein
MKSLLLTEEEKKSILGLYSNTINNSKNNSLLTEKYRIKKLMNLNEGVSPSKIFEDVPGLKKLGELLRFSSEGEQGLTKKVDEFVSDLGTYSSRLRNRNINSLDDLLKAAREWQTQNAKKFGSIVDGGALIDRFLKENNIIEEIETKIINDSLDDITKTTTKAFDDLDALFGFDDVERATMTDGVKIGEEGSLKTQTQIDEALTKIKDTKETVNDMLLEVKRQKAKLGAVDKNFRTAEQQRLLDILIEQEGKLEKYIGQLQKQEKAYVTASEQLDIAKVRNDNTLTYMGKTFDPQVLSPWQRAFYKMGLDKLPEFVTLILRFTMRVLRFQRVKLLQEELAGNVARLIELQRMVSSGYQSTELKRELEFVTKEIENLTMNLQGKDISFDYKGNTPNMYEYFARFIKGSTGLKSTNISDIWYRIAGMLQESIKDGKITQDEGSTILKRIKNVYTITNKAGEPQPKDLTGFFVLKSDLDDLAREAGYEKLTDELPKEGQIVNELKEGQTDWSSSIRKNINEIITNLTGVNTKSWWGNFFKGIGRLCINELILGLPLNLKYYLRPLSKGFNLKNMVVLVGKIAISKAVSGYLIGAAAAFLKWGALMTTMGYTGFSPQECEQIAWSNWTEEMKKYKDKDLGEITKQIVSIDTSKEYGENPVTATSDDPKEKERAQYAKEVNLKFGPLRVKGGEFVMEVISIWKTLPTQQELNTYRKQQQQKLNENTRVILNKEQEKYQDLFYSLDKESQKTASGSEFVPIMEDGDFYAENFTPSERKMFIERTFYRNTYAGGVPEYEELNTAEKIKNTFLTLDNYAPDACVCRKPLAYTEKDITFYGETKTCKIPICDDYVRLLSRKPLSFDNRDKTNIPADGKYGFLIGNSAKGDSENYSDWKPIEQLKDYVK